MPSGREKDVVMPAHYLHEMSSKDEQRFEKIFQQLDLDGNGRIDVHDLSRVLHQAGVHKRYAESFLARSDKTKRGDISLGEFIHYIREHEKNLRLQFTDLDKNRDGKIDLEELQRAFVELGVHMDKIEAKKLLQRMDQDGSLTISYDEWRDFLLYAPSSNIHELIQYWRHSNFCYFIDYNFTMEQMKESLRRIQTEINYTLALSFKSEDEKSSTRAQQCRQEGNRLYATSQTIKDPEKRKETYARVYAYYAQSIAYAPANFQELPLAYGNLSLILLKLEQYSECLQAIDSCLSLGYPDQSKLKIYLRKIECLKTLNEPLKAKRTFVEAKGWIERNQTEDERKIKLKKELEDCYKKRAEVKKKVTQEEVDQVWRKFSIKSFNEEIPAASSAISLNYNESQGRHFVATRDIRPGEILLKERPFALVWSDGSRYNCCWECFQASTNCIPCDCCVNVIFCSVECKEKAWKEYHQHECKLLSVYLRLPEKTRRQVIVAVRILIKAINEYGTLEKLRNAVDEIDRSSSDPRTAGFTDGKLLTDKYRGIYNLITHPTYMKYYSSIAASAVYYIATNTTLLGKTFELGCKQLHEDEDVVFVASLILKHILIKNSNAFSGTDPTIYSGTCLSVVGSTFNHSCFPNALYHPNKSCAVAVAILPIKKGEQVFHGYLGNARQQKEVRQQMLQGMFSFTCECVVCKNDWPLEEQYSNSLGSKTIIGKMSSILVKLNPEFFEGKFGTNFVKFRRDIDWTSILEELSGLIEKLFSNVLQPCIEYSTLFGALLVILRELPGTYM